MTTLTELPTYFQMVIPDTGWILVSDNPTDEVRDLAPQWVYSVTSLARRHRSALHMHPVEYRRFLSAPFLRTRAIRVVGKRVVKCMGVDIIVSPTIPPGTVRVMKGSAHG
jgi:hypothetical protein